MLVVITGRNMRDVITHLSIKLTGLVPKSNVERSDTWEPGEVDLIWERPGQDGRNVLEMVFLRPADKQFPLEMISVSTDRKGTPQEIAKFLDHITTGLPRLRPLTSEEQEFFDNLLS